MSILHVLPARFRLLSGELTDLAEICRMDEDDMPGLELIAQSFERMSDSLDVIAPLLERKMGGRA